MSAPPIPNLNSFKRGGFRGRGLGRVAGAQSATGSDVHKKQLSHDMIVQNTDNDAATSRQSAVDTGYLRDPFSRLLLTDHHVQKRLPLMNRGTYVRTTGIDIIVEAFLSSSQDTRKQIISLGAGSDTRYFRMKQKHRGLDVSYHELDFETNTRKKIAQLRSPEFSAVAKTYAGVDLHAEDITLGRDEAALISADYSIHAQDLRQLKQREELLANMTTTMPTLIISECCLIYLSPDDADAVLQYFTGLFPATTPLAIAVYEPIRPNDSFGKTMISNLASRGLQLQTLEKYHDLAQQRRRLSQHGFGGEHVSSRAGAGAADIDFVWRNWISPEEKERVEALEWMDEVEEFVLLAKHYCISCGWRGFKDDSAWNDLRWPQE